MRAWQRIRTWQNPDGGWRPNHEVAPATWVTALGVTLGLLLWDHPEAEAEPAVEAGLRWLVRTSGAETAWINRAAARAGLLKVDRNLKWAAWPWTPGSTSWVEPTAHSIVALQLALERRAVPAHLQKSVEDRIRQGQAALLDLRCQDGGWNYGNRAVFRVELPSYAQTTGVALHGLQRVPSERVSQAIGKAQELLEGTKPGIAHAWLSISLRNLGNAVSSSAPDAAALSELNTLELALETLAQPGGNAALLRVGGGS
jgi:hypothetical protein